MLAVIHVPRRVFTGPAQHGLDRGWGGFAALACWCGHGGGRRRRVWGRVLIDLAWGARVGDSHTLTFIYFFHKHKCVAKKKKKKRKKAKKKKTLYTTKSNRMPAATGASTLHIVRQRSCVLSRAAVPL